MTLKEYRKSHNLTLTEFSKQIGVSISAISKLENGKYDATSTKLLAKIKEKTGIELEIPTKEEIKAEKDLYIKSLEDRIEELEIKLYRYQLLLREASCLASSEDKLKEKYKVRKIRGKNAKNKR